MPELEEVSTTNFSSVYKSKEVLIQTKEASDLWHIVEKKCTRIRKRKDEVYWFIYGTGGRKMKVISKVIAWMELPDEYKGE